MTLSPIAETIIAKRYLLKDADGRPIETPEDMFHRVARVIAEQDTRYGASPEDVKQVEDIFYHMMVNGLFEPNSPTFSGAGTELGQLSACLCCPSRIAYRPYMRQ